MAGNTDLKGAVIASTQAAVDNSKNSFSTVGALTISDIQNSASYKGTAYGLSIDVGQQAGKFGVSGVGAGIGSDKGEVSSTSSSGISGIAGNTAVRSTDAETGIAKIFDADRVQKEINAQVQITQAFTKQLGSVAAQVITNWLSNLGTPTEAPTLAKPTPAADKLVRSDQEIRAGFAMLENDPNLDAAAKTFFKDVAGIYDNYEYLQARVKDAQTDPQAYQQSVTPPSDSIVGEGGNEAFTRPVFFPLIGATGASAEVGAAGASSSLTTAIGNSGITYDPDTDNDNPSQCITELQGLGVFGLGVVKGIPNIIPSTLNIPSTILDGYINMYQAAAGENLTQLPKLSPFVDCASGLQSAGCVAGEVMGGVASGVAITAWLKGSSAL